MSRRCEGCTSGYWGRKERKRTAKREKDLTQRHGDRNTEGTENREVRSGLAETDRLGVRLKG